jgi:SAM-dependent methyltransferase
MRDLTPLCLLAKKHETDKGGRHLRYGGGDAGMTHEYTPIYWDMFGARADTVRAVLELGINAGSSLRMWEEFFPNAEIIGVDSNAAALINEGRIRSYPCDCGDLYETRALMNALGGDFDLIIDDASHEPDHQVVTAQIWPHALNDDGILVIEDVGYQQSGRLERILDAVPGGFIASVLDTEPIYGGNRLPENLVVIRRAVGGIQVPAMPLAEAS